MESLKEKLKEFISNNKLNFRGHGSDLNSEACILCGYALHIGVDKKDVVTDAVKEQCSPNTLLYISEIGKVWDFACYNNYGSWWEHESAKSMYKF